MKKEEPFIHDWWEWELVNLKQEVPHDPSESLLGIHTHKPLGPITETHVHPCLFTMAKKWSTLHVHQHDQAKKTWYTRHTLSLI